MKVTTEKEIEFCNQCPHAHIEKIWTADSFDDVSKIHCNMIGKIVHGYLDRWDKANIPSECPFNEKNKEELN